MQALGGWSRDGGGGVSGLKMEKRGGGRGGLQTGLAKKVMSW